jgi:hypothetical protein
MAVPRKATKPVKKVAKKRAPAQVPRQAEVVHQFKKHAAQVINDYVEDVRLRARLLDELDLPNEFEVIIYIHGMEAFEVDVNKMSDEIAKRVTDALGTLTDFDEIEVDDIYPS